jgi:2,4-dienoyl-CoA reductase-like NADH-dependent reductase (Old Yellow Enzyme family)
VTVDSGQRKRLLSPVRLGPVTIRNRTVKAATFETMTPRGEVSDDLIEWHREFAAGGVGMTTLAYCAAGREGLTFKDQIWMRPEVVPGLERFTAAMHHEGAAVAVQLGHAGWFADPKAIGGRPMGPSAQFSPKSMSRSRAMTEDDMARVRDDFATAGRLAVEAGFDAVEVHLGHGYLLSQFLCPWNNKRKDAYGGSIENRARFPRQVVAAVRAAVGTDAAVTVKLNMEDGFKGGLQLDDGIAVARWLQDDGTVDAIQLTGGHTTRTPMFLMRGDTPRREMTEDDPNRLRRLVMRAGMELVMADYDFEEAFFLSSARKFLAAVDVPLMLLGGVTKLSTMTSALAEGFAFVAMARALIRQPDFVARIGNGTMLDSPCIPCNQCMAKVGVRPTRCVYRPYS